jgi:hypothetical protein
MIYKVEHDSKIAGHMGQDKSIQIIKCNVFGQEWTSILKTLFAAVSLANIAKRRDMCAMAYFPYWSWPMHHGRVSL